jgi:pentatricopeptide repeat protein
MTVDRLFSTKQLDELTIPYPDRILRYIHAGKTDEALSACNEMRESRILLHDFFADSCTVLWSFIGEKLGEEAVNDMFRYVFKQSAERQFYDVAGAQVMPHLTVYLLAKSWRAHSCFGAG